MSFMPDGTPQSIAGAYRTELEMFLDTDSLPDYPLTKDALLIFERLVLRLLEEKRWKNYGVPEMGDMNLATHALRQVRITAQALSSDAETYGITFPEKDILIAAALVHDLGELKTGNSTYDLKERDRKTLEIAEAKEAFARIDGFTDIPPEQRLRLKAVYLHIATSLEGEDIPESLKSEALFPEDVKWSQLKRLFDLYERYGYLITATQQSPFNLGGEIVGLSEEDSQRLKAWNRPELERAFEEGNRVSESLKAGILLKNVLINQWPHILEAAREGIPSASVFFNNVLTKRVILGTNQLMALSLDFSPLEHTPTSNIPAPQPGSTLPGG